MKTETPSESRALPVAAHTPGPWTESSDGKIPVAIANLERKVGIAIVESGLGHGPVDFREVAANARLIAAAPELLVLLQDVGQWLEAGLSRGQISRGTANRDGDLVSQIRSVIAKAKGE